MIRQLAAPRFVSAAAFAAALIAAPAAFAGQPLSAELQSPLAAPAKVLAGGAVWLCEGSTCHAEGASERTLSVDSCRALVKAVGPVAVYGANFDAARLAKCDAGFGAATVAKAAVPADVASTR